MGISLTVVVVAAYRNYAAPVASSAAVQPVASRQEEIYSCPPLQPRIFLLNKNHPKQ